MTATHAPGPWALETRRNRTIVLDGEQNEVCEPFAGPGPDAALIAAAPDLLAALIAAEKELAYHASTRHSRALPDIRAAIARATGATT